MTENAAVLEAQQLTKTFTLRNAIGLRTSEVHAVDGVSFSIQPGETYGLVGESGCGKSTTGRMLQALIEPTSGNILFHGQPISDFSRAEQQTYRSKVQMIFQDPNSSLNPRKRIGSILNETLVIQGIRDRGERNKRIVAAIEEVGFGEEHLVRYPHEFSGGQRQRIGIARALVAHPEVILCDEAVSALDVSTQAQILNLLNRIQDEHGLSYLFISHDLSVVRYVADRIGVMCKGRLVEEAPVDELFAHPKDEYTKKLLDSIPHAHPRATAAGSTASGVTAGEEGAL